MKIMQGSLSFASFSLADKENDVAVKAKSSLTTQYKNKR